MYLFYCYGCHRDLHSFPTRRSSDLTGPRETLEPLVHDLAAAVGEWIEVLAVADVNDRLAPVVHLLEAAEHRSEVHTSELQSRLHLVCRLLLEKKKNTQFFS